MSKLQKFLLNDKEMGAVKTEVHIAPFPFPFVIQSITEKDNKRIRKECKTTTFNKKTHQKQSDIDVDKYNNRLIVTCCIDPNFKDAALQEKHGVRGGEELIDVLLNPGQYTDLLLAVQEVNGFTDDINDLREEAKNSSPVEEMTEQ